MSGKTPCAVDLIALKHLYPVLEPSDPLGLLSDEINAI